MSWPIDLRVAAHVTDVPYHTIRRWVYWHHIRVVGTERAPSGQTTQLVDHDEVVAYAATRRRRRHDKPGGVVQRSPSTNQQKSALSPAERGADLSPEVDP